MDKSHLLVWREVLVLVGYLLFAHPVVNLLSIPVEEL